MASENEIKVVLSAEIKSLLGGLQDSTAAVKNATNEMTGYLDSLKGTIENLKAPFMALSGLLAGGALFGSVIKETQDWALEVRKLSMMLGISTEEASAWATSMQHFGISIDSMSGAVAKLQMRIANAPEVFKKWGVSVTDTQGRMLPMADIITELADKYNGMSNQTERNQMLQDIARRGYMELVPIMKNTSVTLAAAKEKAEAFGMVVGKDGVAQAVAFKQGLNDVQFILKALANVIGQAVAPVLKSMTEWLAGNAQPIMYGFGTVVKYVVGIWHTFVADVQVAALALRTIIDLLTDLVSGGFKVLMLLLKGDFRGAWEEAKKSGRGMVTDVKEGVAEIKATFTDLDNTIKETFREPRKTKSEHTSGGKVDVPSQLAAWEAQLEKMKADIAASSNFMETMGATQEARFWMAKIKIADKANGDYAKVVLNAQKILLGLDQQKQYTDQQAFDEEVKNLQKELEEYRKVKKEELKESLNLQKDTLASEEAKTDYLFNIGAISEKKRFEMKAEYARKAMALDMEEISNEQIGLDKNSEAWRKLEDKKLELTRKFQRESQKAEFDALEARAKKWGDFFGALSSGFESSIQGLIQGTMTWGQAFKNVLAQAVSSLVSFFVRWGAEETVKYAKSAVMQTTDATRQIALTSAIGATTTATSNSVTTTVVANNTAQAISAGGVAATEGAKSAAQIPYVGWAIAIGAGLAILAACKSFNSAAGGWDQVPSDQMAMIHKNEMILPAPLAQSVRDMAASGGSAGGAGEALHVHFHGEVIDGSFWSRQQANIVKTLANANRQRMTQKAIR